MISKKILYVGVTIVILLMVGIGTVQASQKALPGDILYTFKVNVVEEVKSASFINSQKKAEYESERVHNRIEEVKKLIESTEEIDEHVIQEANTNIEKHTAQVMQVAEDVENSHEDATSIQTVVDNLKFSIDSYRTLIDVINEKKDSDFMWVSPELSELLDTIENTKQKEVVSQDDVSEDDSITSVPTRESQTVQFVIKDTQGNELYDVFTIAFEEKDTGKQIRIFPHGSMIIFSDVPAGDYNILIDPIVGAGETDTKYKSQRMDITIPGDDTENVRTIVIDAEEKSNYPAYLTDAHIKILQEVGIDPASLPKKNMTLELRTCLIDRLGQERYDTLWYQKDAVNINDARKAIPCSKYL